MVANTGIPLEIPICQVGDIAEVGASHRDIHEKGERGAFDVEKGYTDTDLYPGLWHLNAPIQRAMVVEPDCHLITRPNVTKKRKYPRAQWACIHFNTGYEVQFQFPWCPLHGKVCCRNKFIAQRCAKKPGLRLCLDSLGKFNVRTSTPMGT